MAEGIWPAGGILSTVDDLLHYGNLLLNSFNGANSSSILKQKTIQEMWRSQTGGLSIGGFENTSLGKFFKF